MPIETTEHGTVYTQAEIDREFVARAKVRDEYVPKADHLRRLESKNERINALQGDLVSVRASVSESSTYVDRIAELEDRLHAQTDRGVYADLGLLDAEGTPDEAKLRHFRWVFEDHVSTLDAPPEDNRDLCSPAPPRHRGHRLSLRHEPATLRRPSFGTLR